MDSFDFILSKCQQVFHQFSSNQKIEQRLLNAIIIKPVFIDPYEAEDATLSETSESSYFGDTFDSEISED